MIVSNTALPKFISVLSILTVDPVTLNVPVTVTLSSIVVVPPAESIVRLPEDVSISLLSLIPI